MGSSCSIVVCNFSSIVLNIGFHDGWQSVGTVPLISTGKCVKATFGDCGYYGFELDWSTSGDDVGEAGKKFCDHEINLKLL